MYKTVLAVVLLATVAMNVEASFIHPIHPIIKPIVRPFQFAKVVGFQPIIAKGVGFTKGFGFGAGAFGGLAGGFGGVAGGFGIPNFGFNKFGFNRGFFGHPY